MVQRAPWAVWSRLVSRLVRLVQSLAPAARGGCLQRAAWRRAAAGRQAHSRAPRRSRAGRAGPRAGSVTRLGPPPGPPAAAWLPACGRAGRRAACVIPWHAAATPRTIAAVWACGLVARTRKRAIISDVKDPRPGYSPREACIQGQLRLWRVSARRRERHGEASHLGFVNARRDGFPPNEGAARAQYGAVYVADEEKMRAAIHTYIHWCGFLSWREARARLYRRAFVLLS
jgi:hypothetical protein